MFSGRVGRAGRSDPNGCIVRTSTRLAAALAAVAIATTAGAVTPSTAQAATCTPPAATIRWVDANDFVEDLSVTGTPAAGSWVFSPFHEPPTVRPITAYATFGPDGLTTLTGSLFALTHTLEHPVSGAGLRTAVRDASFDVTNLDSITLATSEGGFTTIPRTGTSPTWTDSASATYTSAQLTTLLRRQHATITGWSTVPGDQRFSGRNSTLSRITLGNETDLFTPEPTATASAATTTQSAATPRGVVVRGSGYAPCERVLVTVNGRSTGSTLTASTDGSVSGNVRLSSSLVPRPGTYRLDLVGQSSGQTASAELVVRGNRHHGR